MIHLKSEADIDALRAAADLVGRTLAAVAPHIQPGVTTAALDAVAEAFIRDHGATPAFKGYHGYPASLCVSVNDVVVHGIPGAQVIDEGDLVSVDCGVVLGGFVGDSAYTFAVGELSPEKAQLCRTTYEALTLGVAQAVVGRRLGDVSAAVQDHCEAHGFGVVRELVGHGIGRQMHEEPQVPNYGRRGTGRKLREGLTFCIEPMINLGTHEVTTDADGWTIRTADGAPSCHYEHMVAVRRGRPEVLSTFAYIEQVVEAPYKEDVRHG